MQRNTNRGLATIKKHNAKNEQQNEYPAWIENSDDHYMTTKRPLPQSDQDVNEFV